MSMQYDQLCNWLKGHYIRNFRLQKFQTWHFEGWQFRVLSETLLSNHQPLRYITKALIKSNTGKMGKDHREKTMLLAADVLDH